ncbi:hypothetical protein LOTGIDRAFT_166748 [Lottia gigantea]|uniref:Ubiquitin carboxyl-terminal hydrolase n=1 Tax=Lottia gigantea TaxID=225164 RepID=V3ZRP5_LOTGI|nr:hypothetical protein LOTGIDRAFT_166748 [Lottia gigantea]ESO87012.1 hypothetical protein LOTGIDRAFT_166748 [Lottia gigantea]
MEVCKHLKVLQIAENKHNILNPEKWMCFTCGTTASVWACLSCRNVACGRFNNGHALRHFQDKKHPLAIEVNDRYVYCYKCDEYLYGDNVTKDLTLLREALSAITTQSFEKVESRGQRLLRSYSNSEITSRQNSDLNDKFATAVLHHSRSLLSKVLTAWQAYVQHEKDKASPPKKVKLEKTISSPSGRKRTLIPGVTGLRNLGNTCYMNSILQCLGHLEELREFILEMEFSEVWSPPTTPSPKDKPKPSCRTSHRLNTVDYFQHLSKPVNLRSTPVKRGGGLSGGEGSPSTSSLSLNLNSSLSLNNISLWHELHGLLRVLWSGKWSQVSPHGFLHTVWNRIPMFKGYSQHDAQEFLCELLDKLEDEVPELPETNHHSNILTDIFQGQLVSSVTCMKCDHQSSTYEPFLDLSLEFPDRYQITSSNSNISDTSCHVTEMLSKFTEIEMLEGAIYSCENCNKARKESKSKPSILCEACKQLLINKLPPVLRLHLKRFRWSGRYHREKIAAHVRFDEDLDMSPYCSDSVGWTSCTYRLAGVVVHHGWGFGSGHYTSYCWSNEADSWLDCNDSKVEFTTLQDVQKSQAYILFYTQVTQDISDESLATPLETTSGEFSDSESLSENSLMVDEDITFNFKNSDLFTDSNSNASATISTPPRLKRRRTNSL